MHACVTELTEVYKKSEDIVRRGVSCHCNRAKGINGGLQQDVGKVDDGALNSCRDSDLENLEDIDALETQLRKAELITALRPIQAGQNHNTGKQLRNDSCNRNAFYRHMEADDKNHI